MTHEHVIKLEMNARQSGAFIIRTTPLISGFSFKMRYFVRTWKELKSFYVSIIKEENGLDLPTI